MALYRTKNNTPGYHEVLGIAPGVENSWVNATSINALSSISEDLPPVADGTSISMDDISIPSPWAKFVSFEAVLFGGEKEYGPLHKQALYEWRGLLTLLAIHEIIGIDIKYGSAIDIKDSKPSEERFFKGLKSLMPKNFIFSSIDCWNRLVPINICEHLRDFNIGMLSNSTLVCPPYKYSEEAQKLLSTKPFFVNGKFVDPIPYINSDSKRKYAMHSWVTQLSYYIRQNLPQTETTGKVITLLDTFASEIGMPMGPESGINVNVRTLPSSDVYGLLENIKLEIVVNNDPSPLQLQCPGDKKLILISKEIMGITFTSDAAQAIKIIGAKTLSQIGDFKSKEGFYAGEAVPSDTKIYIAEDLLLDKLTLIESVDSIINENADDGIFKMLDKDIVWPINPDLFDYLSAAEIRERITIEQSSATEYAVKLKLKLNAGECVIEKRYGRDEVNTISEGGIPYISIWPYAKVYKDGNPQNLWKKYYIHCAYFDREHYPFKVGAEKDVTAAPYKMNYVSDEYITRSTYIYEELPTHIKLYDKNNTELYIGAVLLAEPKKYDIQTHTKWQIGFDFGTTSTTAFGRDSQGKTEFIKLGKEYYLAKNSSTNSFGKIKEEINRDEGLFVALNPATFENDSNKNFVPELYLKRNAYPSMYEQQSSEFEPGKAEAFTKGHSMFDYAGKEEGSLTKVYTDLKWNASPDVLAASRNYIYQILSQIVYAAVIRNVGEIKWKLSYPTALSRTLLEGYKKNTKAIIAQVAEDSGVKCTVEDNHTYYTESIASAEFFGSEAGNGLFACIDIGGGSTDISVWKKGIATENLLQTSINLASRAIFLPSIAALIVDDKDIGNYVIELNGAIARELKNNNGVIDDSIRMGIEGILFEYENRVQEIIENFESKHKKTFQKCISIGFASLLYYAVDTIGYVKDKIAEENSITICLGGNGAKLYNWFPDFYKQELKVCLREYMRKVIGRDILIEIKFDHANLKTEAAKGLLNIDANETEYNKNTVAIMGEIATVIHKDGQETVINGTDNIYDNDLLKHYYEVNGNAAKLDKAEDVAEIKIDKELKNLHSFIELCNEIHKVYEDTEMLMNYSEDDWTKIYDRIKVDLSRDIKEGIMSPIFALGIRAILHKEHNR